MKALSIRQPWAWMIVHGWKDIENRNWPTSFRGRFLVHASKGMTHKEYDQAMEILYHLPSDAIFHLPAFAELERGGIVGSVNLVDCVKAHRSQWFFGIYGFVLKDPVVIPFIPCRGQLDFFEVESGVAG